MRVMRQAEEAWETIAVFADVLSAHVLQGRLAAEGIPTCLSCDSALFGVVRESRVLVPPRLVHRARSVLWLTSFSDEELATLALEAVAPE